MAKFMYSELISTGKFQLVGEHLALNGGQYPHSISEDEFNFLRDFIIDHKLKNGYEIATGFGISALAAGLAMKETGGRLISLDSYSEGETQKLIPETNTVYPQAKCFRIANHLLKRYGLDNVDLEIGWSPEDTPKVLDNRSCLDYVFIDGCHTKENVKADIKVLEGKICGYIFFHDISNSMLENAIQEQLSDSFKVKLEKVGSNLGMTKI